MTWWFQNEESSPVLPVQQKLEAAAGFKPIAPSRHDELTLRAAKLAIVGCALRVAIDKLRAAR
jgi:hypothetical protein